MSHNPLKPLTRAFVLASVLAALVPLAGCAMFAPRYDATLDTTTTNAYGEVAQLAAQGELGSFTDKASYAAATATYADVLGKLAVAKLRAGTLPVQGGAATKARDLLVGLIDGCSTQVTSYAGLHKTVGIQPASGETQPMMVACDQAAKAAQAMKQ